MLSPGNVFDQRRPIRLIRHINRNGDARRQHFGCVPPVMGYEEQFARLTPAQTKQLLDWFDAVTEQIDAGGK